jgi:pyruvate-formate lyase
MLQRTKQPQAWRNFSGTDWQREINVRDFIVCNVTPYVDGPEFLAKPTKRTLAVWEKLQPYFREEAKKGVLDVDVTTPSSLTSHAAGYIDRDNEVVVGLQTDKPSPRDHAHRRLGHDRERSQGDRARSRLRGAKPSPSTARRTTRRFSTCTRRRSARAGVPTSSLDCRTPMAAAASSATTGVLRCTAWTA